MRQVNCYIPIKLCITGRLSDAQLDELGETLMRALAARISFAERTIASQRGGRMQSGKAEIVRAAYNPSHEDVISTYRVPSYRGESEAQSISLHLQPRSRGKPWFIRRAINFRTRLGNFFDFLESLGPLPDKALYIDQYKNLHWVSLWLVEVNQEYNTSDELAELAEALRVRAEHLSGGPVYYAFSVKERHRQRLIKLDEDRIVVREIPNLQQHNTTYVTDKRIAPGGWLLFVSIAVPKVAKEGEIFSYLEEVTLALPLHAFTFIVDGKSFERIVKARWNDYLSENGDQPATLRMLPVSTKRRAHFQQLKYLIEPKVAGNVDKNSAYFGNLYLLNERRLNWLPPAARTRARELTNNVTLPVVESRREGWWEPNWTGAFIYAVISPAELQSGLARLRPEVESAGQAEPKETPEQLIERFRRPGLVATVIDNTWLDKLGAYLVRLTRGAPALSRYVQRVLDELGTDRGSLALTFAQNASDSDLDVLAASPNGRLLLVRLYDELISGKPEQQQARPTLATAAVQSRGNAQQQAERVLVARVRSRSVEVVRRRLKRSRLIFPLRLAGPTVYDDAPIDEAELLPDGRIRVKMPKHVDGTLAFRAETQTLPGEVFTTGLVLDADEWIRVKLYDEGGIVVQRPALYLLELYKIGIASTSGKIKATAAIAASFGLGGVLPIAAGSRVVYYLDLAATGLGFLGIVVDDHRGWIIKTFGKYGQGFVDAVGVAQQLAAVYGLGRLALTAPKVISDLRHAWRNWRSSRAFSQLIGDDLRQAQEISQKAEHFLNSAEEASRALRKEAGLGGAETPVPIEAPVASPPAPSVSTKFPEASVVGKGVKLKAPAAIGNVVEDVTLETKTMFEGKPQIKTALERAPRAARALKKCNTPCFPDHVTPSQIDRLDRMLETAEDSGIFYNEKELTDYLRSTKDWQGFESALGELEKDLTIRGVRSEVIAERETMIGGAPTQEGSPATAALRAQPGKASGGQSLPEISGQWFPELRDPVKSRGITKTKDIRVAQIPGQIAKRMRGMDFKNFDDFRETFWKMVASDPVLKQGWTLRNLRRMENGLAPFVAPSERVGGGSNAVYQLNHKQAIKNAGEVYNLDNIEVVSPRLHGEIGD